MAIRCGFPRAQTSALRAGSELRPLIMVVRPLSLEWCWYFLRCQEVYVILHNTWTLNEIQVSVASLICTLPRSVVHITFMLQQQCCDKKLTAAKPVSTLWTSTAKVCNSCLREMADFTSGGEHPWPQAFPSHQRVRELSQADAYSKRPPWPNVTIWASVKMTTKDWINNDAENSVVTVGW